MRKSWLILVIIAVMSLFVFVSCKGGGNSGDSVNSSTSESVSGSGDGGPEIPEDDVNAPVITVSGDKTVSLRRGETFVLPSVSAEDDVDGEVEVSVTYPDGNVVTDGVFCTTEVGSYEIVYFATDSSGNSASEKITVNVSEKAYIPTFAELQESVIFDWDLTYSDFTSGERENVADIKSSAAKAAITGASEGFSEKVMHITGSSTHDIVSLSAAKGNIKGGYVYTFEFWYYGVSTGADYFIAYNGSGNRTFLGDPFQNGLKKAKLEYSARDDETGLTFFTTGSIDVYIGNMTVSCKKAPEERSDFYSATHAQLMADGGYTYDWSENNIAQFSNNATYVSLADIESASLKSDLEKTGAFISGYALKFAGQGSSYISFLSNNLTVGNEYTLTFDAFVKTPGSICTLLMDKANQQASRADFKTSKNSNGTTRYTATFTAKNSFAHVNIYIITSCELYISTLNVSEKVVLDNSIVERSDYYSITFEDVAKEGGYTYDLSEGNALKIENNAEYRLISNMPDSIKKALDATGEFTSGYALKLAGSGSSYISAINRSSGVIKTGYQYTVSFNAYQSVAGSICMLLMGSGREQKGRTEFTVVPNGGGMYNYTTTFNGEADYYFANIYIINSCELYISDFTVSIFDPSTQRKDFYSVTYADMAKDGGYTYDWSEGNLMNVESNVTYVKLSSLKESVKAELEATGAFKNGYAMRLAGVGSSYISCLRNNLIEGYMYSVSFNAYKATEGGLFLLMMGGQQVAQCTFNVKANANGTYNYSTTFKAQKGYLAANLYISSACDLYLADFTIEIIEKPERETLNVAEDSYIADGVVAELVANGYAGSNAIAVTPEADSSGVWVSVPALGTFKVGATVHVSLKLNPTSSKTYASVNVYDGFGKLVDYAYPAGGWSSVNYDAPVVEKNGVKYVYVGIRKSAGETVYLSEITVDANVLPQKILGGVKLIQMENANTQMNGYVLLTDGKVVVIDGGDTADASALYDVIKENGGKVHSWFITHLHIDHVNALITILNGYNVEIENLYYDFNIPESVYSACSDKDLHTISDLAAALKNNASKVKNVIVPKQKDAFVIGSITVKVLNNAYFATGGNTINNSSITYKVETPGEDVVFFGDLGDHGDDLLSDEYFVNELKTCTVVQAAHHGQGGVSDAVYKVFDEIKICLYSAPAWLYDNDSGKGINTATYGTLLTRALVRELGVRYSYSAVERVVIE